MVLAEKKRLCRQGTAAKNCGGSQIQVYRVECGFVFRKGELESFQIFLCECHHDQWSIGQSGSIYLPIWLFQSMVLHSVHIVPSPSFKQQSPAS